MNFKDFYNQRIIEEALHSKIYNIDFYKNYLRNKGWNITGMGARGTVFDKSGKSYVLKLYKNDSRCIR